MKRCSKCKVKVESGVQISDKYFECDNCHSDRKPKTDLRKQPKSARKFDKPSNQRRPVIPSVFKLPKKKEDKYKHLGNRAAIAKKFCKKLTKEPTKAEMYIKQLLDAHFVTFTPQMPIPTKDSFYIVDFYIHSRKICLEIDGGYHDTPEQIESDKKRDRFLESKGLKVIRITNKKAFSMSGGQLLKLLKIL